MGQMFDEEHSFLLGLVHTSIDSPEEASISTELETFVSTETEPTTTSTRAITTTTAMTATSKDFPVLDGEHSASIAREADAEFEELLSSELRKQEALFASLF